ncbi:Queuosine precursor transporter QueT [Lentibacillus sp. JNUCC-1]|uniref:QueT transporter family protein n=1 Tax=Lentibacillus sp. JNUCC-1 TaxID=2654513 RepID=UPI00132C5C92|nr:QueT transporter family protein [Lentibacillus sp. JNUCC-1]MUV37734.1 Queuosine precursor transporter QueT [Lentibacillus sp. JNUCC-1]
MSKIMTQPTAAQPSLTSASEMTKMALVAALYVTVTALLAVISFGAIQIRLSEMFNYLALFHKRYVVAVTAGVVIVNFMSPTWVLDVPVGGTATLLVLLLCRLVTRRIKNVAVKLGVTAVIFSLSMFTVAFQLTILFDLPFFYTWLTVGAGELLSMSIGGIVIYYLSQKVNLAR